MSRIAALDIGGTKIASALIVDGAIADRRRAETPEDGPEALVAKAVALLHGWDYEGIGVATTGYVETGRVHSVNLNMLAGWRGFALEQALRDGVKFSGPMLLLNDAMAAAWAEYAMRRAEIRNLAFVTVSTGIGGGLVIGGELAHSPRGLAGHFGHMKIADQGLCGCGRIGCVEAVASGRAMAAAARETLSETLTAAEIFERNDEASLAIIERSAAAIGELCANLRLGFDADLVAIGGGIGLAPGYIARVRKLIAGLPEVARIPVQPASCGADAGLMGVALRLAAKL